MHTFKNFKNFADVEIDLSKPMTLLIGRNGSGKSNLIEGVELLAELLKKREVHEISDIERKGEFEIRGSLRGCFRQGTDFFEIGFKDHFIYNNAEEEILWEYKVLLNPLIQIKPKDLGLSKKDKTFLDSVINMGIKYKYVSVFDIHPRIMRQYSPIGLNKLSRNGENISSVLYYLQQKSPDVLQRILKNISELPEESFISFEFITTSDDSDVLFALKYPNGEIINAKLLSDGTLRALAILTALETIPEGSRIIIEEIDNGVHASRTKILLDAIWETSHRRNLKTLITTHNSATLDGLDEEQLSSVVVCHYDKESESAKLTPFLDLPHIYTLLEKGKLGGLVTRNAIEHYLDPKFEEKRQAKMQSWLESIE